MPVRFHRNRILIISIISILIVIYLINTHLDNRTKDDYDVFDTVIKKDVKRFADELIHETTTKTTKTKSSLKSRSLREELVEIDGKKLRKIDWHDYELIARENARTGDFHFIYLSTSYYFVFN